MVAYLRQISQNDIIVREDIKAIANGNITASQELLKIQLATVAQLIWRMYLRRTSLLPKLVL